MKKLVIDGSDTTDKNDVLLAEGVNRWRKLELNRLTRIKKLMIQKEKKGK